MARAVKLTATQRAGLRNVAAGKSFDHGRPYTQAHSAGWGQSRWSCIQKGWLIRDRDRDVVTSAGRALAGLEPIE